MRHKWLRLKEHHYICTRCGAAKLNQLVEGNWIQRWMFPTEPKPAPVTLRHAPDCEPGPDTERRLKLIASVEKRGSDDRGAAVSLAEG